MLLALVGLFGMLAVACGGDDDEDTGDDTGGEETATEEETQTEEESEESPTEGEGTTEESPTEEAGGGEVGGTIEFGLIAGWDEGVATTYLWKHLLEEEGFTVEVTQLDTPILYTGLDQGDLDVYTDAWLPATHDQYMTENIVELHTWYEEAGLFLTVPSYVEAVSSLEDLSANADLFESTITGIEPSAGMMATLRDSVMPAYGLEDWTLLESSTSAMLAELQTAIDNQEPIVVTLWSPGWWYGAYDLKNLEDPQDAWGPPDHISVVTRSGFEEDFPQAAEWLSSWMLGDDPLSELENYIRDAGGEGNAEQAVETWLAEGEYADVVEEWGISGGSGGSGDSGDSGGSGDSGATEEAGDSGDSGGSGDAGATEESGS